MNDHLEYSKDGLHLTEGFEGFRSVAYRDVGGIWTIGYGHTGEDVHPGMVINREIAEGLLYKDIQTASNAVKRLVKVTLNQNEFDSITDMVFNIGQGNFEKSTLLRLVNSKDFEGADKEFVKWARAKGKIEPGLLHRRTAEATLFSTSSTNEVANG